jgi:hypothetical protein
MNHDIEPQSYRPTLRSHTSLILYIVFIVCHDHLTIGPAGSERIADLFCRSAARTALPTKSRGPSEQVRGTPASIAGTLDRNAPTNPSLAYDVRHGLDGLVDSFPMAEASSADLFCGRVAQTCMFFACLRFPEGTAGPSSGLTDFSPGRRHQ